MLFVFSRFGWLAEKITVSPLAGVPAKPQLALLFQLAFAPPPDQLNIAACMGTESRTTHIATIPIKVGSIGEKDENRIAQFVFFIGTFLRAIFLQVD